MTPLQPDNYYHIYNHANGSENLFRSDENYSYFLRRYFYFISSVADTYVYCLLPNHLHLMVRIKSEAAIKESAGLQGFKNLEGLRLSPIEKRISQQFSNLFNSYTKSINKAYSRRGSLFIPRFKRKEVTDDNYFTRLIRYIHNNPVNHGFVDSIRAWPWSSYRTIIDTSPTELKRDEVLSWFGNRNEFIKFHEKGDPDLQGFVSS